MSRHGSTDFKDLSDWWGLSAAEEGRAELHPQSRAGNTKQGLVISRQSSIRLFPTRVSCLSPA